MRVAAWVAFVWIGPGVCFVSHAQSSNGVLREVYGNIGGTTLASLTNHPSYPDNPSFESIEPSFEAPVQYGDDYGQRLRALLVAPQTGDYTFWIASDDQGILYLSTDETPSNKREVARVNTWTASREWTKETNQQSAPIPLEAGREYYIEALQKEGTGGDHLAVRWRLPTGAIEEPILAQRLRVFGLGPPMWAEQPSSVTVVEGGSATFRVRLQRALGASYQWYRDGAMVPGATNSSLTLSDLTLQDDASSFYCQAANPLGTVTSLTAILSVLPDSMAPSLETAGNLGEPDVIFVVFSEPVEPGSGQDPSHYQLDGGAVVERVTLLEDQRTVILSTTSLELGRVYTLTVSGVMDRASVPNAIAPGTQTMVALTVQPLDSVLLRASPEPIGPSSRRHGVVISEVLYHPALRADGRQLEFIEIHNSQPWFQELGGWRLSGAVDYVFPEGTVLPSHGYLVVATNPGDAQAVFGLTGVLGPFELGRELPNDSGTLRLRNRQDAVQFEMTYDDEAPYPADADGAGPSLVLAFPSYGEADPRAWASSQGTDGTPGRAELFSQHLWRNVRINEFLAHTDLPDLDFIELHNAGATAVGLSGCILTDDFATNKFVIPPGTTLPAGGRVVFTEVELGFALSASGERILLKSPNGTRVIDAVRFGAQENGVSVGRYPDGAFEMSRLESPTPGAPNRPRRRPEVVIHEILYEPASADADDEFIELHNPGPMEVDLSGWRIREAVSFDVPAGVTLPAGGFLVVGRNASRLRARYPGLNTTNTLGNYTGRLGNSGDRVTLDKPDEIVLTNALGQLETDVIHIVVDEVPYRAGGRWSEWAAGGGSSLERIDPRADGRLAPNWRSSDESAQADWVLIEHTGVMDHGWADANQLHVTLEGVGEALVDDIEVRSAGGANLISNGAFEQGVEGWVFQGNHRESGWEPSEGYPSAGSLHVRASGRGDTGSNRIRARLPYTLSPGTTVTLRARVRWLKGNPNLLLRLRGNWLEATGYTFSNLPSGTPGRPNSTAVPNAGPAITEVRHYPALPGSNEPVRVLARAHDPDGMSLLTLHYRIDPAPDMVTIPMTNHGGGFYSTTLPPRPAGTTAAFHLRAADHAQSPAESVFPEDGPSRECVVRWGDTEVPPGLGAYRLWMTTATVEGWIQDEKMSNHPKDVTFVYGTNRVIYNAGAFYHGSPYHSPSYNSPVGSGCDYDMRFPPDEPLLGETDINLFRPGNGGGDATGQAEIHGYWFAEQLGIPFLYHRPVVVYVNGQRRGTVFHDAQQPNGDFVRQWFPNDSDGKLHKIKLGFEFGDQAYGNGEAGYAVVGADLRNYVTTGGVRKLARYRQTWPLRSVPPIEENDYAHLFDLVDAVNTSVLVGTEAYSAVLTAATDVEEWYRVHVTQHLYNNRDSFSYGGGQNAFAYKPRQAPWKLLLWDIDFAFTGSPTDANLLGIGGADHGPVNTHPPFARIYWQTLIEAAQGLMTPARSHPILDARYAGLRNDGANVGSPQGIKDFIAARRDYILAQVAANQASFSVIGGGGASFTTDRNLITLSGTAPLEVRSITVNGQAYPLTWTSLHSWRIQVPLESGTNQLWVVGLDNQGRDVEGAALELEAIYTGPNALAEEHVVINEIHYHPAAPNAGFIELHNTSLTHAFDLSGWRLDGVDYDFANGTILEPGAFLVIPSDATAFAAAYGPTIAVIDPFPGRLDNGGETLTLLQPGPLPGQERMVDQVTYDDELPWPAAADGLGSSLQLIDPFQDNNRVANWAAVGADQTNAPQSLLAITQPWKYQQTSDLTGVGWMEVGYEDGAWPVGPALFYREESELPAPKSTPLTLGRTTYYFRTRFTHEGDPAGAALKLSTVVDDGAIFYLNGEELFRLRMPAGIVVDATFATASVGNAIFEGPFLLPGDALREGENVLAVEVHQHSTTSSDIVFGLTADTTYETLNLHTPGKSNVTRGALPPFPEIYLNEVSLGGLADGPNSKVDRFGEPDPWVEIYNAGSQTVFMDDCFLGVAYDALAAWGFPSGFSIEPGQWVVVWLDGEPAESVPGELHASIRLAAAAAGSIVLSRGAPSPIILDYLNFEIPVAGRSFGSFPDGQIAGRRLFAVATPGASNDPTLPFADVRLNEWMADNESVLADPADGRFEDWIELYNPGEEDADLSGYFATDDFSDSTRWSFPEGTVIPARGYLLIWADGSPEQHSPYSSDRHASFSLSREGEVIGLFSPEGLLVDGVTFGSQSANVSTGRYPDGEGEPRLMTNATPRSANLIPNANRPPSMEPISDRTLDEGVLFEWDLEAEDPDLPPQALAFSLEPGAPPGMTIDVQTGRLSWTPDEGDGPGVYVITARVSDDGEPSLSVSQSFVLTVREVNNAPLLAPIASRTIKERTSMTATNFATDSDAGPTLFRFELEPGAPDGMTIDADTGTITWSPGEAQGPGNYSIGVRVSDDGEPPLSSSQTFGVSVLEINEPPTLSFVSMQMIEAGQSLGFAAAASDPDLPMQSLTFLLEPGAPAGVTLDPATGEFAWFPRPDQLGAHLMTIRVSDDGTPPLSASRLLQIEVVSSLEGFIQRDGDRVMIQFPSVPGRSYRIEYKDTLDAALWTPMPEVWVAEGPVTVVPDSILGLGQRFYRIVELP